MEETNWFRNQIKKLKLFFIYKKFEKSETYRNTKIKFKQGTVYNAGLEFDDSFEKVLVKNKYLLDTLEDILKKNNLEIIENIDPQNIPSILTYCLYNKINKELIVKFFSIDSFGASERIYFYILENYR